MKKMQLEYEIKYGKKNLGCSVTYNLEIYEIPSTETYPYPTRIIDTCGFCDARGIDYDSKIIEDIKNLFVNSKIDNLNAICLIFKANDTRAHTRAEYIINKFLSLFSDDFLNNFIIIFTFAHFSADILTPKTLEGSLTFVKVFGNIENLTKFCFNNYGYFTNDRIDYDSIYDNNTINFNNFFKYLTELNHIIFENSKKIMNSLIYIEKELEKINFKIEEINGEIKHLIEEKKNQVLKNNIF